MSDKKIKGSTFFRNMINDIKGALNSDNKGFFKKIALIFKAIATYISDSIALILYGRKVFKIIDEEEKNTKPKKEISSKDNTQEDKDKENETNKNLEEQIENDKCEDKEVEEEIPISEEEKAFVKEFEKYINDTLGAALNVKSPFSVEISQDNKELVKVNIGNYTFQINKLTRNSYSPDNKTENKDELTRLCTLLSGAYCAFNEKKGIEFSINEDLAKEATYALPYFIESEDKDCTFYINGIKINYLKGKDGDLAVNAEMSVKTYTENAQNKVVIGSANYSTSPLDIDKIVKDFADFANKTQSISANNFHEYISSEYNKSNILDSYVKKECAACFPNSDIYTKFESGKVNVTVITDKAETLTFNMDKNREITSDLINKENKLLKKCIEKCFSDIYTPLDIIPSKNQLKKIVRNSISKNNEAVITICGTEFQVMQEKNKFCTLTPLRHNPENDKYTFNKNDKDEFNNTIEFITKHIERSIQESGSSFDAYKENFISNKFKIYEEITDENNSKPVSKEEITR